MGRLRAMASARWYLVTLALVFCVLFSTQASAFSVYDIVNPGLYEVVPGVIYNYRENTTVRSVDLVNIQFYASVFNITEANLIKSYVYFGTNSSNLSLIDSNVSAALDRYSWAIQTSGDFEKNVSGLSYNTKYYWKFTTTNGTYNETSGTIFNFYTPGVVQNNAWAYWDFRNSSLQEYYTLTQGTNATPVRNDTTDPFGGGTMGAGSALSIDTNIPNPVGYSYNWSYGGWMYVNSSLGTHDLWTMNNGVATFIRMRYDSTQGLWLYCKNTGGSYQASIVSVANTPLDKWFFFGYVNNGTGNQFENAFVYVNSTKYTVSRVDRCNFDIASGNVNVASQGIGPTAFWTESVSESKMQQYYNNHTYYQWISNAKPVFGASPFTPVNQTRLNSSSSATIVWPTATDPEGHSMTYTLYFGTNSSNLTAIPMSTSTTYNATGLTEQTTYYWYARVTDILGAFADTGLYQFNTSDKPHPVVTYPSNQTQNVTENTNINWTVTDANNATVLCNLSLNGTVVLSNTSLLTYAATLARGYNYTVEVSCIDSLNNTGTYGTGWFTTRVDVAPVYTSHYPNGTSPYSSQKFLIINWTAANVYNDTLNYDFSFGEFVPSFYANVLSNRWILGYFGYGGKSGNVYNYYVDAKSPYGASQFYSTNLQTEYNNAPVTTTANLNSTRSNDPWADLDMLAWCDVNSSSAISFKYLLYKNGTLNRSGDVSPSFSVASSALLSAGVDVEMAPSISGKKLIAAGGATSLSYTYCTSLGVCTQNPLESGNAVTVSHIASLRAGGDGKVIVAYFRNTEKMPRYYLCNEDGSGCTNGVIYSGWTNVTSLSFAQEQSYGITFYAINATKLQYVSCSDDMRTCAASVDVQTSGMTSTDVVDYAATPANSLLSYTRGGKFNDNSSITGVTEVSSAGMIDGATGYTAYVQSGVGKLTNGATTITFAPVAANIDAKLLVGRSIVISYSNGSATFLVQCKNDLSSCTSTQLSASAATATAVMQDWSDYYKYVYVARVNGGSIYVDQSDVMMYDPNYPINFLTIPQSEMVAGMNWSLSCNAYEDYFYDSYEGAGGYQRTGTMVNSGNKTVQTNVNVAPNPPTLLSPANGATNVSVGDSLFWSGLDPNLDNLTYHVWFGTNNASLVRVSFNQTATNYTPTTNGHTTYFWLIEADDGQLQTNSTTYNFTTLNRVPSLSTDPVNASSISRFSSLSWNASDPDADTLTYYVEFGLAPGSMAAVLNNTPLTTYALNMSSNTTYYWRVNATDGRNTTSSGVLTFDTANSAPSAFLSTPANGTTGLTRSPTLTWTGSDPEGDSLTYKVYADTSNPPTTQIGAAQSGTSKGLSGLLAGQTYFWRILANDSYLTNYSETWQFTTLPNEPPNAPSNPLFYSTLFPPGSNQVSGNGYTNAPLSGDRIFWSGSDPNGDSLTYDVYFGTTQASLPLVSTQASTQYNIPGTLLPNTVYYWKIVANDSLNTTAGPVWSFTTRNERAPTVSLAYPSNSQTGVSLSVTLQWSQADADSDPITPTVFFGTDPNALNGYSASDSSRSFFGLSPLTTYYWYVNVSDGMMSSKSSTWSFTTRSTPPLPPTSVCGNGVIEGGEQCDGSAPSGFTCQSCQLVGVGAVCGNTIIEAGEQCDSSAPAGYSCISCRLYANSNDTNTTQCGNNKLEVGEQCDGSAPAGYVCMNCKLQVNGTVCGNLVVEIGEQCDGSAPTNFVCIDCSLIPLNTPVCGNSILEYPEQCDGSAPPGLTCTNCVLVDLNVTPVCGNSIVEPPESCDGSAPAGYTCVTCQLVPIVVPNPVCGNNIVESPETCDGYAPPGFTCDACTLKSIQAVCGNSVTEWGEECDLGNLNGVPNSGCTVDCLSTVVLEPLPTTVCGDGKREGGEACDDGNVVNGDGCSYLCSWESVCGNSIVEAGEQCDDGNTLGGDGCSYACTLETRQPFRPDQGDRSDGLNRGGGQSGNNYVWIWEWDAGTGAMVRKQVRELGSIFRCATNPAAANCGGLTAFLVGNTRYETVNGVTSTIQDYICLDPSTNVTLFTWGVNEASCPSELYAADVNRDGQSDVVTFGGIYDVSQKVLLQQFTGHTSNDIMIPLQLYSDGSLSVIFSSNQSNTVGVYQSGSTSIDGIDTQSGLSVNPDSQKIDIVVPEMTTSTCSADVFYNVEGEWKLCTRIQNIGCGYITAADGSWCGCGDYQVNVTAREVLTGVVTRYSFEQTVPTTQCEQVVVASNRCSIAPDGEFNFHDDVTFHGWSSNAMVVGSTYTPSAKIQTDGKYAYMLNGAQIEHELNSCEYTQLDVEANIGIVSEIGYNFGVNIYGRTTKKTSALIGGFVLLDNELPNSTDANPLVETPNYANLYVYDVSATRADSSLIPVAYVPSVAECGGSTSLSGGLKLQVVAGQDASADIKFTDSDGLSGSLRINVGDTETLTMNSVDYEISLLSNSNGQYSFVVNGEAVVVQAKDPNVACLRRLRLSLDLMTRSYSIEYEYAPGEFQMLSRSVPFASQDIVGFNAVVVENRFNPNNPMGSLVVVDYVRTLGGEGIVDEELLRDETRRAKEYAFSMLDTCSSEGTLDDEYQKLVGHCTAMNSVGLTTSVYCGIDMLRDAVYYNRDCYKGALKYCQMVTFAKTNGMTSPDSVNAVGDLPQQDSLEGSLGCSTALMVGASNDALLQPIWNTVSRILWKNIWTVAVIALLVMLWAMGRQGGRQ